MNILVVVVGSSRTPRERPTYKKLIVSGPASGTAVGSALTIFGVGPASLPVLSTTGPTGGTARPHGAIASKKKPVHDDVSDVPGRYGTGGTRGGTVIGTPVISLTNFVTEGGPPDGNTRSPAVEATSTSVAAVHVGTALHSPPKSTS